MATKKATGKGGKGGKAAVAVVKCSDSALMSLTACFKTNEQWAIAKLAEHYRDELSKDTYPSYIQNLKAVSLVGADGSLTMREIFTRRNLRKLDAMGAGKGQSLQQKRFYTYKKATAYLDALELIDPEEAEAIAAMRFKRKHKPERAHLERDGISKVIRGASMLGSGSDLQKLTDTSILSMAYMTGMRNTELRELEIGDVDIDRGIITIRSGKGGKRRSIGLMRQLQPIVLLYLRHRPESAYPNFFVSEKGGLPLTRDALVKRFQRISRVVSVRVRCHDLRRSFATAALHHGGMPIDYAQLALGHSSVDLTRIYCQTSPNAAMAFMRDMRL